ncbi:hypothetical protein AJ85_03465 [Alkalihalobacillus alcalophilus ATCC 27647 = CGMCC 1.3604]|uniref:Lipoprotein n=1 Tax=Alkalihalobacillus alcalophilus ATCC 27647 = CGMCC 1.3604 TaxID=1218173 RepID=A0A094YUP2_ALKAL|nr:DUF6612 family protein [Alkalihalobacillus alcalophilus]KGA97212.1 hypothetical protein BALCAV_0211425 [Alkalihalobacillus alcalophilus ATCC 27647 = CGMCC 1.3604]MED1561546.1 hypothetical protein [Alkalihalobacillus alcalophilus]THG88448.1 hypothetical protein AJ85_03465 [Alkalihalobacillus alcalophilus ATCC 27647 = CGMCC 1.3604]
MKKFWLSIFLSGALILGACSNEESDATPADESTDADNNTEEVVDEGNGAEDETLAGELSAEDILTKSMEAMNEINSFSSEMVISQEVDMGEIDPELGDSTMTTDINMTMDAVLEPFAMHQVMDFSVAEFGESFSSESYLTEDGMFEYEPTEDVWYKYPEEFYSEIMALGALEVTPEEQLAMLQGFGGEIEVTEEGDHYILTVSGADSLIEDLADEVMSMTGAAGAEMEMIMEMMNISDLSYSLYINKETFLQESIDMTMTMELNMEEEGISMKMIQTTSGTFSNYDGVDEITIPEDIIESAIELDEDMLSGFEIE